MVGETARINLLQNIRPGETNAGVVIFTAPRHISVVRVMMYRWNVKRTNKRFCRCHQMFFISLPFIMASGVTTEDMQMRKSLWIAEGRGICESKFRFLMNTNLLFDSRQLMTGK